MASISTDAKGKRRIIFLDEHGKRRAVHIGKMPLAGAREVKQRVESILAARLSQTPLDGATARWIGGAPQALAEKLAAVGLIPRPETKPAATLEAFIEGYIQRRTDVSPHTRRIWRQTKRRLAEHFGGSTPLAEITKGAAGDWRLGLVAAGLADASVRKHTGFAKHFFAQAVDHELIPSNPFGRLVSSPVANPARQYFVSREEAAKVIEAAPDAQWRLIIALSRYGGLRCPSEHVALSWDDVDWAGGRITVHSPKTARHAGHESRVVPLFPELRPFLDEVYDQAAPGRFVIVRRDSGANWRTQLTRIVQRAGLNPWPRIFHNLRSSRQTELEESFPSHVVCRWIGNSQQVARKHYLQVTDEHYARAQQPASESGAKSDARATQNPAQQPHAGPRTDKQHTPAGAPQPVADCELTRSHASWGEKVCKCSAEVHGNRTTDETPENNAIVRESGAKSDALSRLAWSLRNGATPRESLRATLAELTPDQRARLIEAARLADELQPLTPHGG